MANQITYTGALGPGNSVSALVFPNVQSTLYDYIGGTVTINYIPTGQTRVRTQTVSLNGITTNSDTISGTNHTITIS